ADLDGKVSWWAKAEHLHGKAGLVYSSDHELQTPDGPYFFFPLLTASAPKANLQLGEYTFPIDGLTVPEFGVHGQVRQNLHFAAQGKVFQAGGHASGAPGAAHSDHPAGRLRPAAG